jgi:hypothetical protein
MRWSEMLFRRLRSFELVFRGEVKPVFSRGFPLFFTHKGYLTLEMSSIAVDSLSIFNGLFLPIQLPYRDSGE